MAGSPYPFPLTYLFVSFMGLFPKFWCKGRKIEICVQYLIMVKSYCHAHPACSSPDGGLNSNASQQDFPNKLVFFDKIICLLL